MARLFINYGRADSTADVGRLRDRLKQIREYRDGGIFRDLDDIGPGRDFTAAIRAAIDLTDVMIVVIGPNWLGSQDEAGRRRLDDPEDWVRQEIATALAAGLPILPVLVRGATMPTAKDLPEPIRALSVPNAVELGERRYEDDWPRPTWGSIGRRRLASRLTRRECTST
jgi:hypothetical protein